VSGGTQSDTRSSRREHWRWRLPILAVLLGFSGVVLLHRWPGAPPAVAELAWVAWPVLLAALLLLGAFVSRPNRIPPGDSLLTTEHMFEQLYRVARQVEAQPQALPALLLQLLCELFEPTQAELLDAATSSVRVVDAGSTLLVPVPTLSAHEESRNGTVRLHRAGRGKRLFTAEDARLTERIIEQLQRAAAFDRGVEQGRREERLRLAQDLHDDIGARLLTLMYKAHSPEMEEYVRYTLKDLKTLTRGLADSDHRLSHAAAEWKADLTQRLTEADIAFGWSIALDRDILLGVVQWSALTRILRELVSNAIAHAEARRVDVVLQLEDDRLAMTVKDDGTGRDPDNWSQGVGLSGVRKRVRQLGGDIVWLEATPKGIDCRVRVPLPSARE
jgi:signal transduction histidine kinase